MIFTGGFSDVRRRLREWLYDGAARFAPLMRWALSLWKSGDLALAVGPTTLSDNLCVIVVSAVYRGRAIPVAWVVMPATPTNRASG